MKRTVTTIALMGILAALLFSGCKDFWHPEGPQNNTQNGNSGHKGGSYPIHGTWYGNWRGSPLIITFREDHPMYEIDYFGGSGAAGCNYSDSGTSAVLDGLIGSEYFLAASCQVTGPNQLGVEFHLPGYTSEKVILTR